MAFDKNQFAEIIEEFKVDGTRLHEVAADFRYDLRKGLENPDESSLRMLKSYVGLPTGEETGEYLALDFGGTNVRVLRIRLDGHGKFEVLKKVAKPLRVEGVIASKEGELKVVRLEMQQNASDYTRLAELGREETRLSAELDHLMERWAYLEEIAEQQDS